MNNEKLDFLRNDFFRLLESLPADAIGKWGKMNGQQMVEHVSGFFKLSTNKIHMPLVTPLEHLPKFKEFLLSEKEFRENTRAPMLPEEPLPLRNPNMKDAFGELKQDVSDFVLFYSDDPEKKALHPVFGELNFAEWVQLHHKHVTHHLKQFGIPPSPIGEI